MYVNRAAHADWCQTRYHQPLVETVLSMLTLITHFKKVMHRVRTSFYARFTMAVFNVLVQ